METEACYLYTMPCSPPPGSCGSEFGGISDDVSCCGSQGSVSYSVISESSLPPPTRTLEAWSFPSERRKKKRTKNLKFGKQKPHLSAFKDSGMHCFDKNCVGSLDDFGTGDIVSSLICPNNNIKDKYADNVVNEQIGRSASQGCCISDCSTKSGTECAPGNNNNMSSLLFYSNGDVALGISVMNTPTCIEYKNLRCMILDAPSNNNLRAYILEMQRFGVKHLVRTCNLTYDEKPLLDAGIHIHELVFPDGGSPSCEIISKWLSIVRAACRGDGAVAVHCVAGLGRAPLLAAIALVEEGMSSYEAVSCIREKRRGAINKRQLQFITSYKKHVNVVVPKRCIKRCNIM